MPSIRHEFSEATLTELLRALRDRSSGHPDNPGLIASWPGVRGEHMAAACAELLRRGHPVFRVSIPRRPLFELLAATGLRIPEAIGQRWSDLVLDGPAPHLRVRRAIVKGATVAPKSRHGARLIPLTPELAATLRAHRPRTAVDDAFVFPGRDGGASD